MTLVLRSSSRCQQQQVIALKFLWGPKSVIRRTQCGVGVVARLLLSPCSTAEPSGSCWIFSRPFDTQNMCFPSEHGSLALKLRYQFLFRLSSHAKSEPRRTFVVQCCLRFATQCYSRVIAAKDTAWDLDSDGDDDDDFVADYSQMKRSSTQCAHNIGCSRLGGATQRRNAGREPRPRRPGHAAGVHLGGENTTGKKGTSGICQRQRPLDEKISGFTLVS